MKRIILVSIALVAAGCSSAQKPHVYQLPPALSEVYRGGQLKGLESPTTGDPNLFPNSYDMVQHTCTSKPIFGLYGEYVRTDTVCF